MAILPVYLNLSLTNIPGERWKDIPELEGYFMISNRGRVRRLEYEMEYSNGALYIKPEKIIKPNIVTQKNNFTGDRNQFLVNRVTLDGIKYNLTLSRIVYCCFVAPFDLEDRHIVILCKDGNGLNITPKNLTRATLSDKAKRIVARGRMESPFKHLSKEHTIKQRAAIAKSVSKTVTQYTLQGRKLKTYPSMAAAERATGIHATSIGQRASGKGISAGGFVWRWGKEGAVDVKSVREAHRKEHRAKYGQRVTQYDRAGNKIARFISVQDAAAATGAQANAIRLAIKGLYKSAKGYVWRKGYGRSKINILN
jgi:hypothetical protein